MPVTLRVGRTPSQRMQKVPTVELGCARTAAAIRAHEGYNRSVKGGYSSRRSSMYASTRMLHASMPSAKP